jgi:ATP-dependent helicase YprA (DUF1998 family)
LDLGPCSRIAAKHTGSESVIPSLVAGELQEAIVEYLSTTFALSDDETRAALAQFLADPVDGIFRGPFLRVRTPFRPVSDGWEWPLDWQAASFTPHLHQGRAFERLSSRYRDPQPTVVTTGTGSGKTEAFLYPILDHCARERARGKRGIKALLLYPMNALATDQARRLARLLHSEADLAGIAAGLYVGGSGSHTTGGPDYLVDDRATLRADPPDILLTNYKMLDLLLLRRADRDLWVGDPDSQLRYVVLDEFHTYDGAQGTDVAMLLRRLGASTGLALPGRPLGRAVSVATSATLGAGTASGGAMRAFAERVFGIPFDETAVIDESRQTPDEACGTVDYTLPIPDVSEIDGITNDDLDALAAAFTGRADPFDPFALGDVLLHHPLTRAVLAAASDRSRAWPEALDIVITRAPNWGAVAQDAPQAVHRALARYLALLSLARRHGPGGEPRPLFAVEVQLWVREVSRLLRKVSTAPAFRWLDSGSGEPVDDHSDEDHAELPAAYCRLCGRAGWIAAISELDGSLVMRPGDAYRLSLRSPARVRALIRASALEADARHLDPSTGDLLPEATDSTVPVLVTPGETEAARQECPSCGQPDAVRFLGSQVASLASVSITQLFGSSLVHSEERKLLAFTDSVQDASHRAAFFAGRTYRFNQRTIMASVVADTERVTLDDLGDQLLAEAGNDPASLHALAPPDLLRHPQVRTLWTDSPSVEGRRLLQSRVSLEATLELGLRSRVGRTLELTGTLAAEVAVGDRALVRELVTEAWRHLPTQAQLGTSVMDDSALDVYVRGLLERLRLQGGILHPWLWRYIQEDGNPWRIWGGREDGMPPFVSGQSRPRFVTTKPSSDSFDSLTATPRAWTWWTDWARRVLDVDQHAARGINLATFGVLTAEGVITAQTTPSATVYALHPRQVTVCDVGDDEQARLRCTLCAGRHIAPPDQLDAWIGAPCLRFRCSGRYQLAPDDPSNYYRRLYRSGSMRRVVTAEHTGLLARNEREQLETMFKAGTDPAAPNVIACTPTMELGIDIGDLSAVLLTSVPRGPASYVQRVGRAGRLTGNSFIAAFLPTEPRALYYLSQPEHLIAGEVRPPSCYLDAVEILRRQYFAYLIDRAADSTIDIPLMPPKIGPVMARGLDPDGWLRGLLDASAVDSHATNFVELFGALLSPESRVAIADYAAVGLELAVKAAVGNWNELQADLGRRRDRLRDAITRLEEKDYRDEEDERELRSLRGERHAVVDLLRRNREETTLEALVRIGLLPNYTLIDDASTLAATIWSRDEHDAYQTEHVEYQRPADVALTEFAPSNSFYARGHRLTIDALDIGTTNEPVYEWWRMCHDCGFGAAEESKPTWDRCPRCRHPGIADAGARHLVLRPRQVFSLESEEQSRVFDESDDRQRSYYQTITTLDVDPTDIAHAFRHTGTTFGVELDRVATVRTLNLGPADRPGERILIGGRQGTAPRFHTCRYCGTVAGARHHGREEHRGWCLTRSGKRAPEWDDPILMHEIRTEAVRILLPVSMFEVDERLASFKGALLLGLRLDFGGEPEHIAVLTCDYPGSGGPGRRRFLAIHDTVPGGTGYLGRIADPDRLRTILEAARHAISVCPCRDEGRVACHRCLLGAVAPSELEYVSRNLALELLDTLLADWAFETCADLTSEDIGRVEESELERRFRAAVRIWAANATNKATLTPRPGTGGGGREALELRVVDASGQTLRWLIEEQRDVSSVPPTRPDFLITRQDAAAKPVAVYLDGFQFHASPENNRLDDDATKRLAVRSFGLRVWNLTWEDVDAFFNAANAEVTHQPPDRKLLTANGLKVAQQAHHASGFDTVEIKVADHNPMRALLDYLRTPDDAAWGAVARAVTAGLASVGDQAQAGSDSVPDLVDAAIGLRTAPAVTGPGPWFISRWTSAGGLPLTCLLDTRPDVGGPSAERWTVLSVLDDRAAALQTPEHPGRWRDWLQWANVLQFLTGPGRQAVIATARGGGRVAADDLDGIPLHPGAAPSQAASPEPIEASLPANAAEELDLILDDTARKLTEDVLRAGGPVPTAGWEPEEGMDEGWTLEVAWPGARVAILANAVDSRDRWLATAGWDARPAAGWTAAELLRVLKERA